MSDFINSNHYGPEVQVEVELKESLMSGTDSIVNCGRTCENDETNQVQSVTNFGDAETCQSDSTQAVTSNDDAVEGSIRFSPPLYKQRYECVCSILQQAEVTSVS